MDDCFKITYGIDDGYVGGDRPQRCRIASDEIEPDATEAALIELFWETIEDHMRENIRPHCSQETEFVKWAKEQQQKATA